MKEATIATGLSILEKTYQGRITVDDTVIQIWHKLLSDIDDRAFLAAIYHLVSINKRFPPNVAEVREQSVNLMHGDVAPMSAMECWMHVIAKNKEQLSDVGKKALDMIGGWWQINNTRNISIDRAGFVKAYDQLLEKQRIDRVTTKQVQSFALKHRQEDRLLKAKEEPVEFEHEPKYPTAEEIKNLCRQAVKSIKPKEGE